MKVERFNIIRNFLYSLLAHIQGFSKETLHGSVFYGNQRFLLEAKKACQLMKVYASEPQNAFWEIVSDNYIIFDAKTKPTVNYNIRVIGISCGYLAWGANGIIASILYAGLSKRADIQMMPACDRRKVAFECLVAWLRGAEFPNDFIDAIAAIERKL